MNNVMLDLETMGSGPRAAIVTIGAVFFDPMTGELGAEFEAHIDLRDSARFGEIDPDTVLWWMQQSDEARYAIAYDQGEGRRISLLEGVQKFEEWIRESMDGPEFYPFVRPCMWGNGAGFDCTIMANAYAALGFESWNGFQDRDVRTVVDMGRHLLGFDPKKDMPFEGVSHRALDDAKHQARYVSAIYQRLRSALAGTSKMVLAELLREAIGEVLQTQSFPSRCDAALARMEKGRAAAPAQDHIEQPRAMVLEGVQNED